MKTPPSPARGISLALALIGTFAAPFAAPAQIPYDPPTATGYRSDFFPPRNSNLDGAGPVQYPGTPVVARNVMLHSPTTSKPSPISSGQIVIVNFGMTFSADVSSNGGASFTRVTGPAEAALRNTHVGPAAGGGTRYDTEMLQLNLVGGALPPGVMIRESPTLASVGQTTITPQPGGHHRIDSFFDIFTELSLNGGMTWVPSPAPLHVEMHRLVPEVRVDVAAYPPPDRLVETIGTDATAYPPLAAVVDELELDIDMPSRTFADLTAQPSVQGAVVARSNVSLDGGTTFQPMKGTGSIQFTVQPTTIEDKYEFTLTTVFELTASGGGAGGTVMFRESPTRQSLGKTSIRALPDGSFLISGFFDIFTELSLDGGATWTEGTLPIRLTMAPPMPNIPLPTTFFPPRSGSFTEAVDELPVLFGNGMLVRNLRHTGFQQNAPLPAPGASATITSSHTVNFETSSDGGATWQARNATGVFAVACTGGPDDTIDTEMLSLELSGGNLPAGMRLRESPTRRSVGGCIRNPLSGGSHRIGSFFDIFTEISLDNGATWHAADQPAHVSLVLTPPRDFYSSDHLPLRATLSSIDNAPEEKERFVGGNTPVIRGSALGGLNTDASRTAPPAPGATATHSFFDVFTCEMSLDGGTTWSPVSAPASMTIRTTGLPAGGTTRTFDTEMLAMDIQGGTLPPGVMIRESPTRASTGRTSIAPVDGGFRIGSFFDVFTEISLDGGASWLPAVQKIRRAASALVESVVVGSDEVPTVAILGTRPGNPGAQTANGYHFDRIEMTNLTGAPVPPPGPGGSVDYSAYGIIEVRWTAPAGLPLTARAPVNLNTRLTNLSSGLGGGGTQTFDTEMLSMNVSGGGLPAGVMIRESPSRASRGPRQSTALDGAFRIGSFFDIFTELSLDGGATWHSMDRPLRVDVMPAPQKLTQDSDNVPRRHTISNAAGDRGLVSAGGTKLAFFDVFLDATTPLPPAGGSTVGMFTGKAHVTLSFGTGGVDDAEDAEIVWHEYIAHTGDHDGVRYFDTEMLQLNVSGGSLTPGVMIRESPTRQSLGRTTVRALPNGTWRIDRFFDIFTELSLDGGATWLPSDGPLRLEVTPVAPPALPNGRFFATTDFFPPPGKWEFGDFVFPDGTMIAGMTFTPSPGSPRVAVPSAGLSNVVAAFGEVEYALMRPGSPVTHHKLPAETVLRVTGAPAGSDRVFDTELLSLTLHGVPPGMPNFRFRESPTLPSTGGTRITSGPDDGYFVSSFFDVFTELSLDGGATWEQATGPVRAELQAQPPVFGVPTNYYPPRTSELRSLRHAPPIDFGSGHLLRAIRADEWVRNSGLVDGAPPVVISTSLEVDFELSVNNGVTWVAYHVPALASVRVASGDLDGDGVFDTEMLALDIAGGTLPAGVMVRESPSKASLGRTSLRARPDGSYLIDSFFDVFTELSVDGGMTWLAATKPESIALDPGTRRDFHHSDFLPLRGTMAMDDWEAPVAYTNGRRIFNWTANFDEAALRTLPPPPSMTRIDAWAAIVEFQYSPDGGTTFVPVTAPATMTVRVTNNSGTTGPHTFDTEMLALSIQGGTLPAGVMVRESPSRASLGRTTIEPVAGGFRIGSFFDVFTEISLDGGATWSLATDVMHVSHRKDPFLAFCFKVTAPALADMEMLPGGLAPRAQGEHIKTAKLWPRKSGGSALPTTPGVPLVTESVHDFLWSTADDLGVVTHHFSSVTVTMSHTLSEPSPDGTHTYDTEMLSMSLSGGGGGGGGGMMLRESPTRRSTGQTTVRLQSDGTSEIGSFFDVFTELSLDGGATWTLADVPMSLMLLPPVQKVPLASETMPRAATVSNAAGTRGRVYPTGSGAGKVSIQDFHFVVSSPPSPLPAAGSVAIADLNGDGRFDLFLPDGTPVRATVQVQARARVTHDFDLGGTRTFDTEMLQLSLSSPDLPPGLFIRESPTLRSTGRTSARMLPGGSFVVDSFFDVFTELSLDGGASWTPSDGPLRLDPMSVPPPQPPGSTHFATTDFFPPPGTFEIGDILFPDGSSLRNITLTPAPNSPRVQLPPPQFTFDTTIFYIYSGVYSDPGGAVTHLTGLPATAEMRVTAGPAGPDRYFDTEMLSLTLHGLPPGMPSLRLRESPTLPSLGGTRITAVEGGFMVDSFFDVFFELSLDGGATWQPATGPGRAELEPPTPENIVPSNFYPPRVTALGTLRNAAPTEFAVLRMRNLRHLDYQANQPLVEAAGITTEIEIPHTAEFEVSSDGGATWQPHRAPATAHVRIATGDVTGDGLFDTEMLQLDISGGTLPAGVQLRESPTLRSTGKTTVQALGTGGNFRIGSFFDIFTELSVDGGATWHIAHEAAHVVQQRQTQKLWHASNFRFASSIVASDPDNGDTDFSSSPAVVRAPSLSLSDDNHEPPPAPGQTRQVTMTQDMIMSLSLDGGHTFTSVTAPATVTLQISNKGGGSNGVGSYDTEMLALNVSGGTLPAGVMIRESPTRQSLGRTTIESVDGGFRIGSFFDVFTEISLDGGASWSPAADTIHLEERLSSGQPVIVDNDRFLSRGRISTLPGGIEPLWYPGQGSDLLMEEIAMSAILDEGIVLPAMGSPGVTATIPVECSAVWRQDFGQIKAHRRSEVTIRITPRDQFGNTRTYDTEMRSMGPTGIGTVVGSGGATVDLMIRESPTRASTGRLTVETLPNGTYRIDSFFDVFTELSADGGTTWSPTDVPMQAMLLPAIQKIRESAKRISQHARVSVAADGRGLTYAGGGVRIAFFDVFADIANPLPPAGATATIDFDGKGQLRLAAAAGDPIHGVDIKLGAVMRHDSDDDGVSTYDTEILQLEVSGPTLPAGMMIRESPTKRSTGGTAARQLFDGTWRVDSFFDVFTELSLDSGATWQPSDGPMRLDLTGQSRGLVTGADQNSPPEVAVFTAPDLAPDYRFLAFPPAFTGGVRVAVGDVNGDGTADRIIGAGAGGGPHIKVFSGVDDRVIRSFLAFEPAFTGGVNVGGGDLDGDGRAEIIVASGAGGGPHVKVFSGRDGSLLQSFFAYDSAFHGGVNVAAGDVNGDGFADIITGAAGGVTHVKVFDGRTLGELHSFFAFPATAGVWVAAGDVNGDGRADIVCGAGSGAQPHVRVFNGVSLVELHSFLAYPAGFAGGVRVAAGDVNGDGRSDIITGSGLGAQPHVKVFDGRTGGGLHSFFAYPSPAEGVFVAGMPDVPRFPTPPPDLDGDGLLDVWEHAHFASIDPATFDTDSDDDGLSDGLELGLGSNPLAPDAFGQARVTVEAGYLTMTLPRQPGVLYEVQSARRLPPGLPDTFSPATTTILIDTPNLLKVRDNFLIGTPPSRFIRGVITGAP